MTCRQCNREGNRKWGSCPYCGTPYPYKGKTLGALRAGMQADSIGGRTGEQIAAIATAMAASEVMDEPTKELDRLRRKDRVVKDSKK